MIVRESVDGELEPIVHRSIGTRLGANLKEAGPLDPEARERTLSVIDDYAREVHGYGADVGVIATSAMRRASDGESFTHEVERRLGARLEILPGAREAELSFIGATANRTHHEVVGVIDVGGGSTEYAIGDGPHPERVASCDMGAVRLTEMVPVLAGRDGVVDLATIERARGIARDVLAPLADFRHAERVALVGGSATTAAAVIRGKKTKIDRYELTRVDLQRTLIRLCALNQKARKEVPGMKPQRADILPAGLIVLDTVLDIVGCDRAVATTSDVLLGYLLGQRDALPQPAHAFRAG